MGILKYYRDKLAGMLVRHNINRSVDHRFMALSDISRMHILYVINQLDPSDAQHQYNDIYSIIDWCSKHKIKTEVTLYIDDSVEEAKKFNIHTFNSKARNWLTLKPSSQLMDDFLQLDCDVLLNLCSTTCYPLEYMAAVSSAKFKIGIKRDVQGAEYDFMIESKIEHKFPRDIFDSVMFYLGKIQSA